MQVDAIAVELRPRPMWEAADLGVRLLQANARSVWLTCGPVFAVVVVLALATVEIAPWLPSLIIFWLKPWLDRSVLFVLSRAVFGQSTRATDLWRDQRTVWWRQLPGTLLWRRLSPWRSFTQPIYQLEGQHGASRRQRRTQLLRGQRGAAGGMHFAFANIEAVLTFSVLGIVLWFAPDDTRRSIFTWLTRGDDIAATLCVAAAYGTVVTLLEPFYVAAGFAMYLNRRVQLEAWDIEQEFRRAF
ncbi:MAG: hypothetical protein ABI605_05520 [Rhizobacter sp.]